jgi:histidine triad (HIT) family protein
MASLFSRIVAGEIPCHKIAEDNHFLAFLDVMPLRKGHVLVVPKTEIDYIFDLEDKLLGEMLVFSKQVAQKIKTAFPCKKIGVSVIGLEVPHAHIHLIPMNVVSDMNFAQEKLVLSQEELAEIATLIRNA